jgi:thiamine-monophosphate kinase
LDERSLIRSVMEVIGRENCLDDCAVIPCGDRDIVFSTDMLHETTDFPGGMSDWQIGWMSAAVTLSDLAAMGADPAMILLAVGLDVPERLRGIVGGAAACCTRHGGVVGGGDTDHHNELTVVSSGIGFTAPGRAVRRSGSRPGDLSGITGPLGRAEAALTGLHQYERDLLEPRPRVSEGKLLAASGVTSMMDISDGLVISLYDMLEANSCGYSLDSERIPLIAGPEPEEALRLALYGGGDFELLFTIPKEKAGAIGIPVFFIGTVTGEHEVLLDAGAVKRKGYEHRWDEM